MNKIIIFSFLLLSLMGFCQNKQSEKIENWVFPDKINFTSLKSKEDVEDFFRINYFRISDKLVGTSLEIGMMNSEPSAKLFEIGNNEISLIKTKDGASIDSGGEEYNFGKNNIYFKLPSPIGNTKWSYADNDGTIYYSLCYWKEGKEKFLIVERQMAGSQQFPEKTIEYYSKDKGLIKQENINIKTGKITESYAVAEAGFDSQMNMQDFPLFDSLESNAKDKSPETSDKSNLVTELKNKTIYADGNIPKEYKIELFLDTGLPYLVKDSIIIENKRGMVGISSPQFRASEGQYIIYDGEEISVGKGWITTMKILTTIYFKSPFSFKQELFYFDGEENIRRVVNRKFYFDIDFKLHNNSSTDDFVIKDLIDKKSNLYDELRKSMKEQGIYIKINKTDEDNLKSQKIIPIKFQS